MGLDARLSSPLSRQSLLLTYNGEKFTWQRKYGY